MSGKLTDAQMDQLEQWIGTVPKKFDLLYAITRDGCNPKAFHQKCDNQGPTVTVLYNQHGSIFGGYTALSWASPASGQWKVDSSAFLFRLQFSNQIDVNKFPFKSGPNGVYHGSGHGPLFGAGHDLCTFHNFTINFSGTDYPLNGHLRLNNSYDSQGISNDQVNNGTMNVTELEVYKLTDGKRKTMPTGPWRDIRAWNKEYLEDLKSDVIKCTPPEFVQIPYYRILLIGPVGAGKSSFFNTVASIFRGRIVVQAPCGSAEHSVTSKYRMYPVCYSTTGQPLKFRLCDTRGLEDGQGMDGNDIAFLLDGNIQDGFQFNPSVPISPETQGFKKNTTMRDKVHCVCIVIDGSTGVILPEKMLEKFKSIQSKIYVRGIPQLVVLTKVDKICPEVNKDISLIFTSTAIKEQVNKVSQLLGIPENQVLPIKNYMSEIELNDRVSIPVLLTLRQILSACEDYMENFREEAHQGSDEASGLTPD